MTDETLRACDQSLAGEASTFSRTGMKLKNPISFSFFRSHSFSTRSGYDLSCTWISRFFSPAVKAVVRSCRSWITTGGATRYLLHNYATSKFGAKAAQFLRPQGVSLFQLTNSDPRTGAKEENCVWQRFARERKEREKKTLGRTLISS